MSILRTRSGGTWVDSNLTGAVRFGGADVPFGPPTGNPPESLFTPGVHEPSGSFSEGVELTIATGMAFAVPGKVTHGRYRFPSAPTGTYDFVLYRSNFNETGAGGVAISRIRFDNVVADSWVNIALPDGGVDVLAAQPGTGLGTCYYASVYSSTGRYVARNGVFSSTGLTNGNIHSWQTNTNYMGDVTRSNGRFRVADAFPTQSFNGSCYYVDVVFVAD